MIDTLYLTNFRWEGMIMWAECANPENRICPRLYLSPSLKTPTDQWATYSVKKNPRRLSGPDYGMDEPVCNWIINNFSALQNHWNSVTTSPEFLEEILIMKKFSYPYCKMIIPHRLVAAWRNYVNAEAKWSISENDNEATLTVVGKDAERLLLQFAQGYFRKGRVIHFSDPESSYVLDADGELIAFTSL